MSLQIATTFAKNEGFKGAKFLGNWNGYEVYERLLGGDKVHYVGLPKVILVKGDKVRMSTVEEAFQFLDAFNE